MLRSFWETALYKVISVYGPGNVICSVEKVYDKGKPRVMHKNKIMPCSEQLAADPLKVTTASGQTKLTSCKERIPEKEQRPNL